MKAPQYRKRGLGNTLIGNDIWSNVQIGLKLAGHAIHGPLSDFCTSLACCSLYCTVNLIAELLNLGARVMPYASLNPCSSENNVLNLNQLPTTSPCHLERLCYYAQQPSTLYSWYSLSTPASRHSGQVQCGPHLLCSSCGSSNRFI